MLGGLDGECELWGEMCWDGVMSHENEYEEKMA